MNKLLCKSIWLKPSQVKSLYIVICAMLLHIHPDNPNPRHIKTVIECLLDGGVIIYPTDTIYGLGCDIFQHKSIERIARIKNIDPDKAQLSFICYYLSYLSKYTKSISTPLYRLLKNYLPGPRTMPTTRSLPPMASPCVMSSGFGTRRRMRVTKKWRRNLCANSRACCDPIRTGCRACAWPCTTIST